MLRGSLPPAVAELRLVRPMNSHRIAIVLWIVVSFVTGYYLGMRFELGGYAKRAFVGIGDQQYFAAALSVAGVELLERGDVDGAKRLLGTRLSGYYHSQIKDADPVRQAQLREQIKKTSDHSRTLKDMLTKPTP
jgi:hypothetical protein